MTCFAATDSAQDLIPRNADRSLGVEIVETAIR
jgi:hypothetical protein